jgi:hypothetical protein
MMNTLLETFQATERQRVSDGAIASVLTGCEGVERLLMLVLPQLGDFDSMEYAWWLQREQSALDEANITVRAVGIGDLNSGQRFCDFTGFDPAALFMDPTAELHHQLGLYAGLTLQFPGLTSGQNAWVNLMLMCAGIKSPGTLTEVFRGYRGDRQAPQLFGDDEVVKAKPLPPLQGSFF